MNEDIDPLDAFMQEVKTTIEVQKIQQHPQPPRPPGPRPPPIPPSLARIETGKTPIQASPQVKHATGKSEPVAKTSEEEDATDGDTLEAFMGEIKQVASGQSTSRREPELSEEAADGVDSYLEMKSRKPAATDMYNTGNVPLLEYDENDNIVSRVQPTENLVLPPVNHEAIQYEPFNKCFYSPVGDLHRLSPQEIQSRQRGMDLVVTGVSYRPIAPISSFSQAGFDPKLKLAIMRLGFKKPTVIQSQAIPAILSGKDVIAVAETGSGKTFAFVWPMLTHIMDQRELEKGEGPIGLVLAPTRELAHQLFQEVKRFARIYGIKTCAIYGGTSKWEQTKTLKTLCEVVVGTPGRVIDHIRAKTCPMTRVTFFVLDEADQMLSYGFEPQVRTIGNRVRPDRQTVLFSATFSPKLKRLARDLLFKPVEIRSMSVSHEHISQELVPCKDAETKWVWVSQKLKQRIAGGKVLIFVSHRAGVEDLATKIRNELQVECVTLHGDMHQSDRTVAIKSFKKETDVLVATDVASRGLHVNNMNTVICFDAARNIDTHTHRIGRTGRMGKEGAKPGKAFVLLTPQNAKFCSLLLASLRKAGEEVPDFLPSFAHGRPESKGNSHRTRYGKLPTARVGFGSGRADVTSQAEKTVGLGYESYGAPLREPLSKDANLYAGFVKGETTKPGQPHVKIESDALSREERNAATFTARKRIEDSINASAKSHVESSLAAYKSQVAANVGSGEKQLATTETKKRKKGRWDDQPKKSRWG